MTRYWQKKEFWVDAGERVVTAFVEGTLALLTVDALSSGVDIAFGHALLAGGVASALSTLKAIVGSRRKGKTTPVSIT